MALEKIPKEKFTPAHVDSSKSEEISKPSLNYWQDAWLRVKKNKGALVSLIVIVLLGIMSLVGPHINEYGYDQQNLKHNNLPPRIPVVENIGWLPFDGELTKKNGDSYNAYEQKNVEEYYWFGTDSLGRDIFTRVWKGTQVSIIYCFIGCGH